MTPEQAALIAERMGWYEGANKYDITRVQFYEKKGVRMAECTKYSGEWHLTSAGAFEVAHRLRLDIHFNPNSTFVGNASFDMHGWHVSDPSPHKAVELAALWVLND